MEGEITMESMKYSNTVFPVPLDPRQVVSEVHANAVNLPRRTVREHIEYALDHPIGAGPIEEAVRPGEKICILISDVTRRWQQPSEYLPVLIERLNRAGIPDEDILILCATGTHRQQTKEEHISLVGEEIYRRIRLIDHQCDDREHLTYMGTSSRGTPVWLNSYAMACDKLILTGGVVYHFLAGFGGGRKSIVPGIAGRETINTNHNNALNEGLGSGSNPRACNGNMGQDNPFHSDLVECAAFAKPAYLLNVIVNDDYQIVGAFAGDWKQAHAAAARVVEQLDGVAIPRRTPLVIASAGGFFHRRLRGLSVCRDGGALSSDSGNRHSRRKVCPHRDSGGSHAERGAGSGCAAQWWKSGGSGNHPHASWRQHLSAASGIMVPTGYKSIP